MTTAIELKKEQAPAIIRDDPLSQVSAMLQAAMANGVTEQNMAVLEKMMSLFERTERRRADMDFDDAFAAMQSEMSQVRAAKAVENMYRYATYEEIMVQVQPLLNKYQFSLSYDQQSDENKITVDCILSRRGAKKKGSYTCRVGAGRKGMTEPQIDGAAATTAQRNALCKLLNIVINHSDDKRNLGGPITAAQAQSLRERVLSTGSDEKKFLKWANAATFELIRNEAYAELDAELRKRESTV